MTKTETTIAGTWYTITCTAPATVTQQIDGETATLATLDESGTAAFRATASSITIETDGKYHLLPTKAAATLVTVSSSADSSPSAELSEHLLDTTTHKSPEDLITVEVVGCTLVKGGSSISGEYTYATPCAITQAMRAMDPAAYIQRMYWDMERDAPFDYTPLQQDLWLRDGSGQYGWRWVIKRKHLAALRSLWESYFEQIALSGIEDITFLITAN